MKNLRLKSALLLLMFAVSVPMCLAQDKKPEKSYNRGLEMLYDEDFANAKTTFEKMSAENPDYKDVAYRLELAALFGWRQLPHTRQIIELPDNSGKKR